MSFDLYSSIEREKKMKRRSQSECASNVSKNPFVSLKPKGLTFGLFDNNVSKSEEPKANNEAVTCQQLEKSISKWRLTEITVMKIT